MASTATSGTDGCGAAFAARKLSTQHNITVEVSKGTYSSNVARLVEHAAPAKLLVVMKSNAYGHGISELAPVAVAAGAAMLGICPNWEASAIRLAAEVEPKCAGVGIFRLRMALPEEVQASLDEGLGIEEQVGTLDGARWLSELATKCGKAVRVHFNVDCGMGRSGFFPEQIDQLREAMKLPGLEPAGIFCHFPGSDDPELDETERQLELFRGVLAELRSSGDYPEGLVAHVANSAALARMESVRTEFGMVRAGAATFDSRTSTAFDNPSGLAPVMTVKTRVAQVRLVPPGKTIGSKFTTSKPTWVASLPVGFGEGYPRALANLGVVLIHGRRCNVVGKVSLNITTVDVSELVDAGEEVSVGDECVLFGEQGTASVTFEEMADRCDGVHTLIQLHTGHLNEVTYVE